MDIFFEKLNELLVDTFRDIMRLEERMVNSFQEINLSISELHVLEAVGKNDNTSKTISELAEALEVTLPSVTNAVKKLMASGYVEKTKSETDGRSVNIKLTRQGERVNSAHKYFHRQMVRALINELPEKEKEMLMSAIKKLDDFFKKKLEQDEYEF